MDAATGDGIGSATRRNQGGLGVATVLRFALRELRGGLRGFGIFLACIALGVATISGVASLARGMTEGIAREGGAILGGDVALTLVQRQATDAERAYLADLGSVSEVASTRAMARKLDGSDQALVELKAVDGIYSLYGSVKLEGGGDARSLLAAQGATFGGLAEPELLTRLGLAVGDRVMVGASEITITGVIAEEPDRLAGGLTLGPRLMVSQAALAASGLVQPGSLVNWSYRVRLANPLPADRLEALETTMEAAFPKAGWQVRTREDSAPGLKRTIERFAEFLTLIGLTALIVGGVGVANAVSAFLDGKRDVIATFKCLGAPARFTVAVYLVQIMALAALGILIGLVVGAIIPFAADAALRTVFPVAVAGLYPLDLALAAVYGAVTALAFAILPLGRAREVSPTALFRDQVAPARTRPRLFYFAAASLAGLAIAGLAIGLAFDRRIAIVFVVAAAASFVLLRLVAHLIQLAASHAPRSRSAILRLALGNIHRPGALTPSIVLSLGLGLTLLVALVLIDGNFRRELTGSIPANAPSFFFLDIQSRDVDAFGALIATEAPGAKLDLAPMLRGRIVAIKGVPADKAEMDPGADWVLRGDRGITYAATAPDNAKLVEGSWWPADYSGTPLVSFEAEAGRGLHLKLGDTITVNVLGREITAKIANFREVTWQSLSINFVMVFSPNTFAGAPYSDLATLTLKGGGTVGEELALSRKVAAAFPAVTTVRIKEAIDTINSLAIRVGWAVRGASAITLVASILVLGGAFAAGRRQRLHDAVVLKTLGATRNRLLSAFAIEFLALGLATALFGLVAGSLAAWFVLKAIMEIDFVFLAGPALAAAAIALVMTLVFGLAGTWRILGAKAAPVLRNL